MLKTFTCFWTAGEAAPGDAACASSKRGLVPLRNVCQAQSYTKINQHGNSKRRKFLGKGWAYWGGSELCRRGKCAICCLGLGVHQDGRDRRCADAVVKNKGRCRKREKGKPQTDGAHLHVLPRRYEDRAHWNGETPRAHSLGRIVAGEWPVAISFYVTDMQKGETSCMHQWVMAE